MRTNTLRGPGDAGDGVGVAADDAPPQPGRLMGGQVLETFSRPLHYVGRLIESSTNELSSINRSTNQPGMTAAQRTGREELGQEG